MASIVPRLAPSSTVEDQSLAELLRERGSLEPAESAALLRQLFVLLSAQHELGAGHGGVTPERVRVSGSGDGLSLRLLDFDPAVQEGSDPLWAVPEQRRQGYRPLPSSDVWSLGLLTFFTLAGAPYYWLHVAQREQGELVPASQRACELSVAHALPAGFDAWFQRAAARSPEHRFADAGVAWQALEPLLLAARERSSVVVKPGLFITLVLASVIGAGLAIFWLLRSMRI